MEVQDWSSVAASNTSVGGISTDGTVTPVKQIDNMFRGMMADIRTGIDGGYFLNPTYAAKSGNYTAVVADRGDLLHFTAAATLTLTAAATLTAGWWIMVRARGGNVTVDPNSAELINGAATLIIADGNTALIFCDGTGFWTAADVSAAPPVRNRIVNPAMQVSQERANTSGTTNGFYGADQWSSQFVTSAGTITTQRVQSLTPNGSKDRYRVTVTVADASLAAGELLIIRQILEGNRVADFDYGTASAKQSILRFGFKGPAGTYAVSLNNAATNRSYVALFTITAPQANTDTEQTLIIPGDTTGTWLSDNNTGMFLQITLAAGSTFQGTTGWQAGNILGTSAVSNGMATGGNVFELFDVGFYRDKDNIGIAPKWEAPDPAFALFECQRYWIPLTMDIVFSAAGANFFGQTLMFPVPMRIAPTLNANADGTPTNVASTAFDAGTTMGCRVVISSTGAGTCAIAGRTGSANAR